MNLAIRPANQLTLALSKGRIFTETMPLLEAAGIRVTENPETSRKLILPTTDPDVRVIIVRASDVPTYVQYGAADFGVAGKDVLMEHGMAGLYAPIDLNIAKCRMSVAVPAGFDYASAVHGRARRSPPSTCRPRASTSPEGRARRPDQALRLDGTGSAGGHGRRHRRLVSTGGTLRANNLVEVEEIVQISSRLVVNRAALKLKRERLTPILDAFERASAALA